jgi:hypothetical protein
MPFRFFENLQSDDDGGKEPCYEAYEIWGSHGCAYVDVGLPSRNGLWTCGYIPVVGSDTRLQLQALIMQAVFSSETQVSTYADHYSLEDRHRHWHVLERIMQTFVFMSFPWRSVASDFRSNVLKYEVIDADFFLSP